MEKNYTDVVIDNKVYTVGCDRDNAYMQELAAYVNEKLDGLRSQPGFNKQPYGSRQVMILMNVADDYLRMKMKTEATEKKYQEQTAEFYNMKREMVNMKLQMDQIRLQNQVLSMGLTGNEEMKERLMAEVISSIQADESKHAKTSAAAKKNGKSAN